MLNQLNEEYFKQLNYTAQMRLRPSNISGFFIATFIYSTIMIIVSITAVLTTTLFETNWFLLPFFLVIFWGIHLFFMLFFISEKISYKMQRFQAIILCFIAFKLSIEGYAIYFLICADQKAPTTMYWLGLILLAGGILFMVYSLFRAIHIVKKGDLKEDGKGLFDFSGKRILSVITAIIALIFIATFVLRFIPMYEMSIPLGMFFALIICSFLHYLVAMASSEFFLLAYCKFKYSSFIVEPPKRRKR